MDASKRQAHKFLVTVSAVVAVLAKRAIRLPRKLRGVTAALPAPTTTEDRRIELRSTSGSKKLAFIPKRNKKKRGEEDWGAGGVWQKAILMGDKCEPLDFSGVIYYDSNGKQVNEMPLRSPRANPAPGIISGSNSAATTP
ncbi:hypothetical protein E2542_SST01987 [Spatholobus suberectus]|nr:hypothetical protein E2542_SST01987 [Spatholobus suberectus]